MGPFVIYEDGLFNMKGPPGAPSGLFVARSKNETNFDFHNAVRLTIQGQPWPVKYGQVVRDKKRWVMFYGEAKLRGIPSKTGMAVSDDLLTWKKAAFPLIRGHDAEVIEATPGLWLMYYGPDGYFDMPEGDILLAIYQGALEDLHDSPIADFTSHDFTSHLTLARNRRSIHPWRKQEEFEGV